MGGAFSPTGLQEHGRRRSSLAVDDAMDRGGITLQLIQGDPFVGRMRLGDIARPYTNAV